MQNLNNWLEFRRKRRLSFRRCSVSLKHTCDLPAEEDMVVRYVNSGYFVNLRRKLKKLTIVSERNPISLAILKSMSAIRYEKKRHLHNYYYTIHPFSIARAYWEFFIMVTLILGLVIIPLETASREENLALLVLKGTFDVLFIIDIVVTFFTGYYDAREKRIVLRKSRIAVNYISGLFVFDLFSSINIQFILKYFEVYQEDTNFYGLKMLNFLKLMRLATMLRYIDRFRNWTNISIYQVKMFKMLYMLATLALWGSVALYVMASDGEAAFLVSHKDYLGVKGFLLCYERTIKLILGVGLNFQPATNWEIYLYDIIVLIVGFVLLTFLTAQMLQIVNKYVSASNKYYQLTQSLQEFSAYLQLPDNIKQKILDYFDFKYQRKYIKESEIMETLSEQLKKKIGLQCSKNLLDSVAIFSDLPNKLLVPLVSAMKSVIFLPGDVIVQQGTFGENMFFILTGTVAVYTGLGREVCHLAEGTHFGEIALVTPKHTRIASVVAVDPCELYILTRKDFAKAIRPYPHLFIRIKKLAQSRFLKTMEELNNGIHMEEMDSIYTQSGSRSNLQATV